MLSLTFISWPWADPGAWVLVAFLVAMEVCAARRVLRRMGVEAKGFMPALVLVQAIAWIAFAAYCMWTFSGDERYSYYYAANCIPYVAMPLMMVVAEVTLLRAASKGWLLARGTESELSVRQAIVVTVVGNAVAAAALVALFLVLWGIVSLALWIADRMPH